MPGVEPVVPGLEPVVPGLEPVVPGALLQAGSFPLQPESLLKQTEMPESPGVPVQQVWASVE